MTQLTVVLLRMNDVDWRVVFPYGYLWYAICASVASFLVLLLWARFGRKSSWNRGLRLGFAVAIGSVPIDFVGIALCGIVWLTAIGDPARAAFGLRYSTVIDAGFVTVAYGFIRTQLERPLIERLLDHQLHRRELSMLWALNALMVFAGLFGAHAYCYFLAPGF